MTEKREGCYEMPSLVTPPFTTSRRGRYFKNHKTIRFKKLPLFHKSKKQVNLASFKIGQKTYHCGTSKEEDLWLNKLNIRERQKVIFGYKGKVIVVDGIDYSKHIVYEYLGSFVHSIRAYPKNKWDVKTWLGKTPRQMYFETIERFKFLHNSGWKIFFIWDYEFKKGMIGRYYRGENDNLY